MTESQQIVRDVRSAGYDVWYMNALNEGQGFRKKENRDLYREAVVLFFRKHLLGDQGEQVGEGGLGWSSGALSLPGRVASQRAVGTSDETRTRYSTGA